MKLDLEEMESDVRSDFEEAIGEAIEALTAGLRKISAQVEASKPAPQVVSNP